MSSLGKPTLHLSVPNFKFSHTFIICHKLLETDILFGKDMQKRYSLSYSWDSDKELQRGKAGIWLTPKTEQQNNIALVQYTL